MGVAVNKNEISVREFNFPEFEKLYNEMGCKYIEHIGPYTCIFEWYCSDNIAARYVLKLKYWVAAEDVSNSTLYREYFDFYSNTDREAEIEKFKNWYNDRVKEIKELWEQYIFNTFFYD